ncbi:hypothetical protein ACKWTF_010887 [Chironomus riparius]
MKFNMFSFLLPTLIFQLVSGSEDSNESDEKSSEIFDSSSNHVHPFGKPLNILRFGENGQFIVDNETLNDMFNHPDVKDCKIVAVSIIGAFRKGKSFLMDYALRFMYGNYKSVAYPDNPLNNTANWMGEPEEKLRGFSWRGGVQRDTSGVILWSDIFLHEAVDKKNKKNKKLAIVLMDTQGLFDTKTSPTDNSRIFALGTLASSIQIFNLNDVIQENQLEYLHLATEFSQFAMKENKNNRKRSKNYKPFQKLVFLMRDWQNKQDYVYGEVGGMGYLSNVLQTRPDQPVSLANVRNFIKSSFESLDCFLMPHPGATVTTDENYEGQRIGLSEDFEEYLGIFLEFILAPRKLIAKRILNNEVSGSEYVEYIKAYFRAFESDEIPKVETLVEITKRKQYEILIAEAFEKYKSELVEPNLNSLSLIEDIELSGNKSITVALASFKKKKKLGNQNDEIRFENELKERMQAHFTEWKTKHIKAFENLKRIEEENARKQKEAQEEAEAKFELQRQENQEAMIKLIQEQEQRERLMNQTLADLKADSTREIEQLRKEYEEQRVKSQKETETILNEMKKQNAEMSRRVSEAQLKLQQEMIKMEMDAKVKQKEMETMIAERRDSKLEELKLLADQKSLELEHQMKIEQNRQRTEAEQRIHEKQIEQKRQIIRDEAEAERKREFELMLVNMQQHQKEMQQLMLSSLRSG